MKHKTLIPQQGWTVVPSYQGEQRMRPAGRLTGRNHPGQNWCKLNALTSQTRLQLSQSLPGKRFGNSQVERGQMIIHDFGIGFLRLFDVTHLLVR